MLGVRKFVAHVLNVAPGDKFLTGSFVVASHDALHGFNLHLGLFFRKSGGFQFLKITERIKGNGGHHGLPTEFPRHPPQFCQTGSFTWRKTKKRAPKPSHPGCGPSRRKALSPWPSTVPQTSSFPCRTGG